MKMKQSKSKLIDVKIGTEEEAYWTEIKDSTLRDIKVHEKLLKFSRAILELSELKIQNEKSNKI